MTSAESLLEPLFGELSDGVCVAQADGAILYMNPAARRLLGAPDADWTSLSLCELLCANLEAPGGGNYAAACPLRSAAAVPSVSFQGRYGHHVSYEWTGFRIRKQEKWVYLKVRCVRMPTEMLGSGSEKHFLMIQDGTAESELEQHKEDWRNMVAHDLRSPLTNIYGTLRILEEVPAGQVLGENETKLIRIGSRACGRMLELVELYLDIARFDAQLMPVSPESVNASELVAACVEQQRPLADERRVALVVEAEKDVYALADKELVARVLDNLLNNAVKFCPEGTTVRASARLSEGKAVIAVKDQGPGIAVDDIPQLFDRFHQAEARRAGKTKGTGLGLTFCREALRVMGGEIGVSSAVGKGSEFTVKLPAGEKDGGDAE